jgi:hypothetical protein
VSFLTPVQGTPGWFDDPHTPGVTRYWDGQRWTDRSFGEPLPLAPAAPPASGRRGQRPLGPQYPPGYVPSTQRPPRADAITCSTAIWSLVLGIIPCFSGIPAIVLGGKAKKAIRYSGGRLTGEGLATAGQILGWTWLVLNVVSTIVVLVNAGSGEPTYYPTPTTLP